MPLAYDVREPLTIPDDAFNTHDIAQILVNGGRYGGAWALHAWTMKDGQPSENPIGDIFTVEDERPSMAVDTAVVWVNDACVKAGLKLAHFENKNHLYGPDEAPYFASAVFLIDRRICTPR